MTTFSLPAFNPYSTFKNPTMGKWGIFNYFMPRCSINHMRLMWASYFHPPLPPQQEIPLSHSNSVWSYLEKQTFSAYPYSFLLLNPLCTPQSSHLHHQLWPYTGAMISVIWICQHVFLRGFFLPLYHGVLVEAVNHGVCDIMMHKKYTVDLFLCFWHRVPKTLEISWMKRAMKVSFLS